MLEIKGKHATALCYASIVEDEAIEQIRRMVTASVESITGLRIKVTVVPFNSITRSEGKAKRVLDNRIR